MYCSRATITTPPQHLDGATIRYPNNCLQFYDCIVACCQGLVNRNEPPPALTIQRSPPLRRSAALQMHLAHPHLAPAPLRCPPPHPTPSAPYPFHAPPLPRPLSTLYLLHAREGSLDPVSPTTTLPTHKHPRRPLPQQPPRIQRFLSHREAMVRDAALRLNSEVFAGTITPILTNPPMPVTIRELVTT